MGNVILQIPADGRSGQKTDRIAVVVPCYRVKNQILSVLDKIDDRIGRVYVVDDACPDESGEHVLRYCRDPRVTVVTHDHNQGVGGAVVTGYRQALADGAEVIVKLDGDGQMDPALVGYFVNPILEGRADYTKGNRFYNIEDVQAMPRLRVIGNAALSFMTKLSSGYWNIFDPANGYTAISAVVAAHLPLDNVSKRYFFESDMLFRLGTVRACVLDVPMRAVYGVEKSSLRVREVIIPFVTGNIKNMAKRIFYGYFLRDFSVASLQLLFGFGFLLFGMIFGADAWFISSATGVTASTGTVMLAALPIILGIQFLLSFMAFDVASTPKEAIHRLLDSPRYPQN